MKTQQPGSDPARPVPSARRRKAARRPYGGRYEGEFLARVAFPMGGIGAGMICLEGTGALSHVSLRHKADVFNEPTLFSALFVKGAPTARVLEGPVPKWKAYGNPGNGIGAKGGCPCGLPRFAACSFETRFPFATVRLSDPDMPVTVELTGWSPFVPGDADSSGLPVLALEYTIANNTAAGIEAVYSFHAANHMAVRKDSAAFVRPMPGGFVLEQPPVADLPADEGSFAAFVDDPAAVSDCAWVQGGKWFDPLTMLWRKVMSGGASAQPPHAAGAPGNGGSLYLPFALPAGGKRTIRLLAAWHVPRSEMRFGQPKATEPSPPSGCACPVEVYRPWYATRFAKVDEVAAYWRSEVEALRRSSRAFSDCFYDTTLPAEVVEAVAANLAILKSPTCLRQADGRFWGWEGCRDFGGCCGSCTHVWNYAQSMAHLFPALERSLRETEFSASQDERGHQHFRAALPIGPIEHNCHAAADGQLGGIMKVHREWRIGGDTTWMKTLWPRVKQSLLYCIETWDPESSGALVEPHHNTYDIEFRGADPMCTGFYLGALAAAAAMGRACGDDVARFESLLAKGRKRIQTELWNGGYFFQPIGKGEPKYQYGTGCLSDGMLGDWLARCCGVDSTLRPAQVKKHLAAVFRHNFKADLSGHSNPQRATFAFGDESGLLLCSWPRGGKPSLPFPYSDEVWTGIEYQAASHLMMLGRVREGRRIVQAVRDRYDGRVRNPFDEYECGHWYARAMSSYALLQAMSGARYDAVDKALYLQPAEPGDFRAFLCTAGGYGTVGVRDGKPFLDVASGTIPVTRIESTVSKINHRTTNK